MLFTRSSVPVAPPENRFGGKGTAAALTVPGRRADVSTPERVSRDSFRRVPEMPSELSVLRWGTRVRTKPRRTRPELGRSRRGSAFCLVCRIVVTAGPRNEIAAFQWFRSKIAKRRCVAIAARRDECRGSGRQTDAAADPPSDRLAGGQQALLPAADHVIDQAVILSLVSGQDLVAVDVLADLLNGAAAVPGEHLLELAAHTQDLASLDLDVGALTVPTLSRRLVDDDPRVRQRHPPPGRTGGEQHGGGASRLAEAHR